MKAFVFCASFLACASFISAENLRTHLHTAISARSEDVDLCLTELNVIPGEDTFQEPDIINGQHLKPGTEEKRKKTGCLVECALKKINLMDESQIKEAKIHTEINNALGELPLAAKAHKIAHKCISEANGVTTGEECEKGFTLMVCVSKALHKALEHGEHTETEQA